jgi:MerR family transcriptional regulator, thiopeptide resistance regulator
MMLIMMVYTVKKLAVLAGISVRTLHYYDCIGLLKPDSYSLAGYRQYSEKALLTLQQILFFRELGFNLDEIKQIITRPDFDVLAALRSQHTLLSQKAARLQTLIETVEKTIQKIKGERSMEIKEYYSGFSDEQITRYRREVKERWGEKTLEDSEARLAKMGKAKQSELQAAGDRIFQAIADNMARGVESPEVQDLVAQWRQWLENFSHYSDQAVLGLGRLYSQNPEFANFYRKIHPDLAEFFTRAIEYYYRNLNPTDQGFSDSKRR